MLKAIVRNNDVKAFLMRSKNVKTTCSTLKKDGADVKKFFANQREIFDKAPRC
jgi:hypothetical protein